jgi:hypothetical protein
MEGTEVKLPELPPTRWRWKQAPSNLQRIMSGDAPYPVEGFYDVDQMREYAREAVLQERERVAGVAPSQAPSSVTVATPHGCPACEFEGNEPRCTRRDGCVVWSGAKPPGADGPEDTP